MSLVAGVRPEQARAMAGRRTSDWARQCSVIGPGRSASRWKTEDQCPPNR